jgi:D-cysteine desulfhydrase
MDIYSNLPLFSFFPALRAVPRVPLCTFPSPLQQVDGDGATLWIKRDDLNAEQCGGNKARTLEWLLGNVRPGDEVLTLGGEGSTHVLATASHAARLGARTIAFRWRHEMNPTATMIAALAERQCAWTPVSANAPMAMLRSAWYRARRSEWERQAVAEGVAPAKPPATPLHYVPLGGSVPVGVLAHVNAAIELAVQIHDGAMPRPSALVVPLGSGGTMAGLVLGLAIARLDLRVIGVQVTPRIVANRINVMHLAKRTAALIKTMTGEQVARPDARLVHIAHEMYGGAYGRQGAEASDAARWLDRASGIRLDHTYSAKAFGTALAIARNHKSDDGPTLFWNTFDGRTIESR